MCSASMKPSKIVPLHFLTIAMITPVGADVIYSNLQDISVPANFAGVYVDIETGNWNTNINSPQTGWDINPFFGGSVIWNSPSFQPVRSGTSEFSAVVNLAAGTLVNSSSTYSTFVQGAGGENPGGAGYGISETHLGNGSGQFVAGQEGYLGFRLNGNQYGWMRVVLTNNTGGALIKEWAYETSGAAIAVSNIKREGGNVTLDSSAGNFVVGSVINDSAGTTNVIKTGSGITTLAAANSYTGTTTVSNGTLIVNGSVASTSVVVNGSLGGSGVLTNATLSGGGSIDPGSSAGILTAAAVDPSGGLDFHFEFNVANGMPDWDAPTASGNDVLRLTSATPFTGALAAGNFINLYLNVGALAEGDQFTGGFYTDEDASFLSTLENATFRYFIQDNAGDVTYQSVTYRLYDGPLAFDLDTVAQTADFGGGVINGTTMQFTVIPEPSVSLLAVGSMLWVLRRRRR
jgi:autotransporter-associated beta strand protein